MRRAHAGQAAREWTAVQLGCAAAVLLALAAVFLSHVHHRELQAVREQAAQTRAQLMAQTIGQRLAHATAAGIPLPQLVGVAQFLDRWHRNHPEVTRIAVHDMGGRMLWTSHAQPAADAPDISAGSADVAPGGVPQARVQVQLRNGSRQGLGERLALLVPAVLLVSALAYLGALFACAPGPWLRNHGVRMISRWAARGDYRQLLVLPQRKGFDLRVQHVAQAMRRVHERVTRMRLLIGSLRRTEPQQLRRDYLDQVLLQIEGKDRFADAEPAVVRLVAVQVQSLWMGLLICLGALAPLTYALRVSAQAAERPAAWQPALAAACLGLLVLAAAAGWKLAARLRMATLTLLILSQAALLLAPLAMLLGSPAHPSWIAAWNGAFAGAALAACTRAQTHPDAHPGFAHAQPGIRGAALLAWWGGLLWLAPTLGYYAHAALRPAWAVPALLLPLLCGLFLATRWDVAHSPWRVRMAQAANHVHQGRSAAWRWSLLGLGAGLVAGPLLPGLVLPATGAPAALLQQCALGMGLALAWSWRQGSGPRRDAAAPRMRWRTHALVTLALLLAVASLIPWPIDLEWLLPLLQGLLLGLLLAEGLGAAAHAPQDAASLRLLLGCAFGAGLGALALLQGLQDWLPGLALLLLAGTAAVPPQAAPPQAVPPKGAHDA